MRDRRPPPARRGGPAAAPAPERYTSMSKSALLVMDVQENIVGRIAMPD
ncbi:hypothetical protein [Streptomyces sp. NPDC020917]